MLHPLRLRFPALGLLFGLFLFVTADGPRSPARFLISLAGGAVFGLVLGLLTRRTEERRVLGAGRRRTGSWWPPRAVAGLAVDPAAGEPQAVALLTALRGRDWRALQDVVGAATDPDLRAFLMGVLAEASAGDVRECAEEWARAEPESTLPDLVLGCHGVSWAWAARGRRRAQYTSRAGSTSSSPGCGSPRSGWRRCWPGTRTT
ncbi:hypothetical protein [Actinoplanes sp. NPDC051851]|uniref:hypothetical protein n=1 Tax=Actinoplanes sp. NPDC051851 TaxID=3154753 RepID=UPI0034276EEF